MYNVLAFIALWVSAQHVFCMDTNDEVPSSSVTQPPKSSFHVAFQAPVPPFDSFHDSLNAPHHDTVFGNTHSFSHPRTGNHFFSQTNSHHGNTLYHPSTSQDPHHFLGSHPNSHPSAHPSSHHNFFPSSHPSSHPNSYSSSHPNSYFNTHPNSHPSSHPNSHPSSHPNSHPSSHPNSHPSSHPNSLPSSHPGSHQTGSQPTLYHPSSGHSVPIVYHPGNTANPAGQHSYNPFTHNSHQPYKQPTPKITCRKQIDFSANLSLSNDPTGYPASNITLELLVNSTLSDCLDLVTLPPGASGVPVDPILNDSYGTCPMNPKRLWSFTSTMNGRCWVIENVQENVIYAECLTPMCQNCKEQNRYFNRQNMCLKDFSVVSLWVFCEGLPDGNQITRERIIVPTSCSCKNVQCVVTHY